MKESKHQSRERKRLSKMKKKGCWERSGKFNRHHIKAASNGGQKTVSNMLTMDISRHNAYHFLFGNMSFREVAALLLRVCNIKGQED